MEKITIERQQQQNNEKKEEKTLHKVITIFLKLMVSSRDKNNNFKQNIQQRHRKNPEK